MKSPPYERKESRFIPSDLDLKFTRTAVTYCHVPIIMGTFIDKMLRMKIYVEAASMRKGAEFVPLTQTKT